MGLFQPDPRFVQLGNVNSTLPVPHAPIPAQGDDPPRRQVATAVLLATVVGLWPASTLDPVLGAPNNARVTIAPLTLTYGDQPPRIGVRTRMPAQLFVPPEFVPLPSRLRSVVPRVAAVDQPPVVGRSSLLAIVRAWIQGWDSQHAGTTASWDVPPPVVSTYTPPAAYPAHILAASQVPPPLPAQRVRSVVPLLARGDAPPIRGPHSPQRWIVASWADPLITPRAGPSASWIVSVVVTVTPRTVQLVASRSNTLSLDASVSAPALTASRSTSLSLEANVSAPTLTASRSNAVDLDASE